MRRIMTLTVFLDVAAVFLLAGGTTQPLPSSLVRRENVISVGMMIIGNVQDPEYVMENMHNQSLFRSVQSWSKLHKRFGSHMESEIHVMLDLFLRKDEISTDLENRKEKLLDDLELVHHFYQDSLRYASSRSHSNTEKLDFTDRVLSGQDNLPRLLVEIHDTINFDSNRPRGFLPLLVERAMEHRSSDCDRSVSPQQLFYSLYTELIITELMSLVTLRQVYTMRASIIGPVDNHTDKLNIWKNRFENRIRDYHRLFSLHMPTLTKHLHRCSVDQPIRGIDFIELQKFSQIKFLPIDRSKPNCDSCPHPFKIDDIARIEGTEISNCRVLGHSLEVCPAEPGSIRAYSWWKDQAGNYYGHQTPCRRKTIIDAGQYIGSTRHHSDQSKTLCGICACSVDQRWGLKYDYQEISLFSAVEQVSDIWNNKVVTGVRFILWDNAIIIQIQESRFTGMEMIHRDTAWKRINDKYHPNGTVGVEPMRPKHEVTSRKKTMFLDDLIVPEGFAVTGVRLDQVTNDAFGFRVHATKFNFITGELDPSTSFWCESSGCNDAPSNSDYRRERIEINMGEADDPTRGTAFVYDPQSNKKIRFTHTDLYKDGGQTTIPFLDARPLHAQPVFPLSGIGLYYRGMEGFGGYIAPRIFTFDVSRDVSL